MFQSMFYVYILASKRNGTLYTGHTDDLCRRVWEHRSGHIPGFARKYGCSRLVWFEPHDTRESAFLRERRIKEWKRRWKLDLIEKENPEWNDVFDEMLAWVPEITDLTRWQREQAGPRLSPG